MAGDNSDQSLPTDLWWEILSWLPVKSLLRFRCVSKSWQSMIDDPDFCRLHLHRSSSNHQETRVIVVQRKAQLGGGERINRFTLLTDAAFFGHDLTLPEPHDRRNWKPLSSMDGLVMLVKDDRFHPSSSPKLLLWNPSIRKYWVLPPSPKLPIKLCYVDMGFGFDPLINDYKHVRIARNFDGSPQFVAIYTVGLGSWKTVPFQSKGCSSCHWVYFKKCTPCRSRGRLFSIALNRVSRGDELVSFDLSNEVFTSTNLPKVEESFTSVKKKLIMVNGECLFVWCTWNGGIAWKLESPESDSNSMHWTERYSIEHIYGMWRLFSTQGKDVDIEARERKHLLQVINFSMMRIRLFDFVESLILLK